MLAEKCKLPVHIYMLHDLFLWFHAVEANFSVLKVSKEEKAAQVIAIFLEKQLQSVAYLLNMA